MASPENERERGWALEREERATLLRDTAEDWRERARCDSRLVRGDGASSSSLFRNNLKKGQRMWTANMGLRTCRSTLGQLSTLCHPGVNGRLDGALSDGSCHARP